MTYNEKLIRIFNKHGVKTQLDKLKEEVYEFIESVEDYTKDMSKENREHLTEEFADVLVVLAQFQRSIKINDINVVDYMTYKVDRQCKRDGICEE